MIEDWARFPNFKRNELKCKHCDKCNISEDIVIILQMMRDQLKKPIFISSGYRCPEHPIEKMKEKPGEHSMGMAADIICNGQDALFLLEVSHRLGVRRIGLHQKGRPSGRYMHIGIADRFTKEYPVAIWTY